MSEKRLEVLLSFFWSKKRGESKGESRLVNPRAFLGVLLTFFSFSSFVPLRLFIYFCSMVWNVSSIKKYFFANDHDGHSLAMCLYGINITLFFVLRHVYVT